MALPHVLIVDDEPAILTVLSMRLEASGYAVSVAQDGDAAVRVLAQGSLDVVLCDLRLAREDGLALMERLHEQDPDLPVLILTAHGSIPNAVEAMKRGAAGYLTKPVDRGELSAQLARCVEGRRLRAEVEGLRRAVGSADRLGGIVGSSPGMRRVYELITRVAPTRLTVAIHGESGTGKELVARAVHELSPRANREFQAINCAALPDALLQSELFGHERGAFTGAGAARTGLFRQAHGGTLFLDEIADMSPAVQAALLRALQEGEVSPLGGGGPVKVDVRVVVATHRDLRELVTTGGFREDLYYRVAVAPIHIPPLRERGRDVALLSGNFLERYALRHGRPGLTFSASAQAALHTHAWPGNVRELKHAIERAVVMADGDQIQPADLFGQRSPRPLVSSAAPPEDGPLRPFRDARLEWEAGYLDRLMRQAEGNVSAAARIAGRYRADLYGLLRKHDLDPSGYKPD